jgi:hypothetical protein
VHGKTWAERGNTPVVNRPGQRQSISAASVVTSKGAFWFAIYPGGLSGELFVELLKQLMYRRKKPMHYELDIDYLDARYAETGQIGFSIELKDEVCNIVY